MPHPITVPRLGWSMEEGTFGEWLKRDGDPVEPGEPLFVLEGEKSAQDIESLDRGILKIPADAPRPGDTVRVGQILAYLVAAGESAPSAISASVAELPAASAVGAGGAPAAGPAARRLARDLNVDLDRLPGSGPGGKVTMNDVQVAASSSRPECRTISPRARRLAEKLGIDWAVLRGTGRSGRIRERDVRAAADQVRGAPAPALEPVREAARPPSTIRKTIAARMTAGLHEAAPVTLTTRCDATNLVNLRDQFRQAAGKDEVVPGYNELLIKLAAVALARHPQLTHQWRDEGIHVPVGMHVCVAIDTESGLVAPVIRDVDRLTLRQLAALMRELIARSRSGNLSPDDLAGGVFTITNLGMYGIDAFTPIVNRPQSAILGVGRIVREPAVVGGEVVPRDLITLSLTFDHRVVDGAPAAKFLQALAQCIESPGPWLVA